MAQKKLSNSFEAVEKFYQVSLFLLLIPVLSLLLYLLFDVILYSFTSKTLLQLFHYPCSSPNLPTCKEIEYFLTRIIFACLGIFFLLVLTRERAMLGQRGMKRIEKLFSKK